MFRLECKSCEGSGKIPMGEFTATRSGPDPDYPGFLRCEDCAGEGVVEVQDSDDC